MRSGRGGLLVQTAAGSSVGRILSGAASFHNLPLLNIVRSERGADLLRSRIPNLPVVSTERPDWTEDIRKAADGRPVGVAVDPIGGRLAEDLLGLLKVGTVLVRTR